MAAELKHHLNLDAQLLRGDPGEFSVWLDGAKVVDKATLGRFPDGDEVVAALRGKLA